MAGQAQEVSVAHDLPQEWVWTTLGDVSDTTRKRADPEDYPDLPYIGLEFLEAHTMRLLGTVPASEMKSSAELFYPGDVLYGRLRPYLNKVYRPDFKGLASAEFIPFRQVPYVDSKYLQYFLNSWEFVSFASRLNEGDRPRVGFEQLAPYPFPLPPLVEQRRIVGAIETYFTRLDAALTTLKGMQAKLKRYRAAVLKAAVEGTLTEAWRAEHADIEPASVLLQRILQERRNASEQAELAKFARAGKTPPKGWQARYREPAKPDTADLPTLPQRWYWATLSELGQLDRGRSRHRPRNAPHLYGGPYPFIQTGDVRHADTFIREYEQTYTEEGLKQSKLWPAGTLCITIAANIAETAILSFDACFPDSVVGFLAVGNILSTRYVELYLRTIRERLEAYAPATAQKNINLETLSDVAIALPPLAEQEQIVAEVDRRLSVVAETEAQVEADLKRAERLRQSILKQAFAGKLVPQDPVDEPASVLLERIRSQRRAGTGADRIKNMTQLRLM